MLRVGLEGGLDPNGDGSGRTPLYAAAWAGHEVCVRILCDFGADPNRFDDRDSLPLDGATTLAMRRLLLSKGALPDLRRKGISRAAFFATFGERELVELFLSFGASADEKLRDGRTIRELLEEPSRWVNPGRRMQEMMECPQSIDKALRQVLEMSQQFTITPEEYVVRHPDILMWSMHSYTYPDPAAQQWTMRVSELLGSAALREAAIRRYLEGEALIKALRRVHRQQAIEEERSRIKAAQARYVELHYA